MSGLAGAAFAGTALAVAMPSEGEATASSPDAKLIALCDRWMELDPAIGAQIERQGREWEEAGCPGPGCEDTSVSEAMIDEQAAIKRRVVRMRASTVDGWRAKARVLFTWTDKNPDGSPFNSDDELALSLCRDLAGEIGA